MRIGMTWHFTAFLYGHDEYNIPRTAIVTEPEHVRNYDVLIFPGGEDISPHLYGEENYLAFGVNPKRDAFEKACFEQAVALRIPCIGVCRGHQLIAALRGGSLYQDIHVSIGKNDPGRHGLILKNTDAAPEIATLLERRREVNSLHHQGVKRIPRGGEELAVSSVTGVNEAIYYPSCIGYPAMIGVQWHPEMMGDLKLIHALAILLYKEEKSQRRSAHVTGYGN